MNPFDNGKAYTQCKLNGVLLPGKVVVSGASSKRKWDVVAGQGDDGATVKGGNEDISKFKLAVQMWEPAQFDAFERDIRPMLAKPAKGKKAPALEIDHPELAKLEIRRIVVEEVHELTVADESGLFQYEIDVLQYRPAKPATLLKAKAGEFDFGFGNGKPPRELTENEQIVAKLTEQAQKLRTGEDKSGLFD